MRITDVRWTPVFVPFHRPELWVWSRRAGMTSIIIEVETDEGVIGLGECAAWPSYGLTIEVLESIRRLAVGEDPLRPEPLWRRLHVLGGWRHASPAGNPALSGFDVALWDIVGKVAGLPLSTLLGGAVRPRLEYFYYLMRGDTVEVAEEAASAVAAGFQTLYLKIGMSIEQDIALIEAIRVAAGPSAAIRVDPNEGWSFATTRSMLDRLQHLNIELLEQPTLGWNHEELARLRSTRTGILANESSWQERDVVQCLKTAAADVISLDQQMLGSLTLLKKTAGMCEAWGVPVLKHCFGELGIATAAGLHVLSTCPNATLANQSYCSVLSSDVIVGDSLSCTDGFLTVPDGPGLGVELDRDQLETFAEAFQRGDGSRWEELTLGDVPSIPRY
jgi:L-alanine-DL-glutamate epimerase-like enolase superfamily enzyme